uniref:Uncharacterized protein n=1 Tax=Heterorhabditis bacteriophora TaxID=37862 RepID=A0A1I7XA19_HETBA
MYPYTSSLFFLEPHLILMASRNLTQREKSLIDRSAVSKFFVYNYKFKNLSSKTPKYSL